MLRAREDDHRDLYPEVLQHFCCYQGRRETTGLGEKKITAKSGSSSLPPASTHRTLNGLIPVISILRNCNVDTFIKATAQTTGEREIERTTSPFTGGDGLRDYDVGLRAGEISIVGTVRSCPQLSLRYRYPARDVHTRPTSYLEEMQAEDCEITYARTTQEIWTTNLRRLQ
jgi:hypothetical protein